MKQERFEKVVEVYEDIYIVWVWYFGILSLTFPLVLLLDNFSFLNIVSLAFFDGVLFTLFGVNLWKYIKSRKVYWRKIE